MTLTEKKLFMICDALNSKAKHFDNLINEATEINASLGIGHNDKRTPQQTLSVWADARDNRLALTRELLGKVKVLA